MIAWSRLFLLPIEDLSDGRWPDIGFLCPARNPGNRRPSLAGTGCRRAEKFFPRDWKHWFWNWIAGLCPLSCRLKVVESKKPNAISAENQTKALQGGYWWKEVFATLLWSVLSVGGGYIGNSSASCCHAFSDDLQQKRLLFGEITSHTKLEERRWRWLVAVLERWVKGVGRWVKWVGC